MAVRLRERELGLHSKMSSFGDLFDGDYWFVVPYLQRPYEWGETEVSEMVGDLHSASEGGYRNYFLGHIVGVKNAHGIIEIVDGQQRFLTTKILLGYFRDRLAESNPALAAQLQACIAHNGRARVTPRPSDAEFLRLWVQTPGATVQLRTPYGPGEAPYTATSDAQLLMAAAARTIHEKLGRLANVAIEKLALFVLDRAAVDFIVADNRTLAAILYRGMNMRGKQLSTADLVKLEALERLDLDEDTKEAAARTWEAAEDALGRKPFAFLLDILPLIVSGQTTKRPGDLAEWANHAFQNGESETLLLRQLPIYAEVFQEVMSGEVRATCRNAEDERALATVNKLLKCMLFLEDRSWVAPAVSMVHAQRERPQFMLRVVKGLDLLSFACFLDSTPSDQRANRYAAVVRAGADETLLSHALSLRASEAAGMLRRVGHQFSRDAWRRRAMAVRINAAFPNGYGFGQGEDVTVEHILPTSQCAAWTAAGFAAGVHKECANLVGNFALVTQAQNNRASQRPFGEKKKIFFESPGARVHPITEDVRRYNDWTERHIRERTDRFVRLLATDWELD